MAVSSGDKEKIILGCFENGKPHGLMTVVYHTDQPDVKLKEFFHKKRVIL